MGAPGKISKSVKWSRYKCPVCNTPLIEKTNRVYSCYWNCGSFIIKGSKIEEVRTNEP